MSKSCLKFLRLDRELSAQRETAALHHSFPQIQNPTKLTPEPRTKLLFFPSYKNTYTDYVSCL